jgi:hypothetical protein
MSQPIYKQIEYIEHKINNKIKKLNDKDLPKEQQININHELDFLYSILYTLREK